MSTQTHPDMLPELTSSELRRFNRQIILPEFGTKSQQRLKAGSVLLIGLGGLGSPASLYLAAEAPKLAAGEFWQRVRSGDRAHPPATLAMIWTSSASLTGVCNPLRSRMSCPFLQTTMNLRKD